MHLNGLTGLGKAVCESRLGYLFINMLGVHGQYKIVALMLGYNLNFSCCVNKDGFRGDSHKCVCKVVACTLNAYEKVKSIDYPWIGKLSSLNKFHMGQCFTKLKLTKVVY